MKNQVDMKKFCDNVAGEYASTRFRELSSYEFNFVYRNVLKGQRILDLGCGPGALLVPLSKKGYNVIGLDYSKKMLEEASKRGDDLVLVLADANFIPFNNEIFNLVYCLENSIGSCNPKREDRKRITREVYRVLVPGGLFLIDAVRNDFELGRKMIMRIWLNFCYKLRLTELEPGDYQINMGNNRGIQHFYSPHELIRELKDSGFKKIKANGKFWEKSCHLYVAKK